MSFKSYSRVSSVRSGSPLITVSNSKCSARTTLICLEVRWVTWVRLYKCTYYIMLLLRHSGIRLALDDRRVHTSSIVDTYYATTIKPSGFRKCGWRTRPRRARPVPAISPYLENSYRGSFHAWTELWRAGYKGMLQILLFPRKGNTFILSQ